MPRNWYARRQGGMKAGRRRITTGTRFAALQACWVILRGGSVAYRIDFTDDGARMLSRPWIYVGCQDNGKPLTVWNMGWASPEGQPD